jgi:hypothetical protein
VAGLLLELAQLILDAKEVVPVANSWALRQRVASAKNAEALNHISNTSWPTLGLERHIRMSRFPLNPIFEIEGSPKFEGGHLKTMCTTKKQ